MKTNSLAVVALLIVGLVVPSRGQADDAPTTIVVEPVFGKPKTEVLKVEDEANRHYEKWRVTQTVVLVNLPPSAPRATYVVPGYVVPIYSLCLQSDERRGNLLQRFAQLKDELSAATFADFNARQGTPAYKMITDHLGQVEDAGSEFKGWRYRQITSFGQESQVDFAIPEHQYAGALHYFQKSWTYEVEGAKKGRKTLFKAQVEAQGTTGGLQTNLCRGQKFNIETGKIEGTATPKP